MMFSITEQEKGDLLRQVTAWTGLTVYIYIRISFKDVHFNLNLNIVFLGRHILFLIRPLISCWWRILRKSYWNDKMYLRNKYLHILFRFVIKMINSINKTCRRCDPPLKVRVAIVTLVIEIYYKSTRGSTWLWSYGSWIYNYLCNRCLSPLMLWVRLPLRAMSTTLWDKVCQWLAAGRWFPPGSDSSTNKLTTATI